MKNALFSLFVAVATSLPSAFAFTAAELAPQTQIRYPTVQMNPDQAQRDIDRGVIYFDEAQREQHRIVIINGLAYYASGNPVPDSIEPKNKHGNMINYVMDAAGNFYLFDEYATPKIRHSSIFAAKPVAGSGEIAIERQVITHIDSNSGHYYTRPVLSNAIAELRRHGVTLGDR